MNKPNKIATKINNMDIEAAAAFGVINAPSLLNPLKVFATISAKAAITNKVNNSFDKYGYVDILTSGKNNFDFKSAVIKYVLKDLGL